VGVCDARSTIIPPYKARLLKYQFSYAEQLIMNEVIPMMHLNRANPLPLEDVDSDALKLSKLIQ
jgi:hypothetical protein